MNQKNSKRKQQTADKKPNNVLPNSAMNSTQKNITQTDSDTTSTNQSNNASADKTKNLKEIGKCNNQTEIEIAQRANRISEISVIVNIFMFIATIAVFIYSVKSTDAATKSAEVADSTLKVTKSLFEVQNEPYLQIDNFKIDTFTKKDGIKYKLVIKNLGNYPVKIVDCIFVNTIRKSPPPFDSIPNMQNYSWLINKYIVKDNDFIEPMKFPLSEGNFWAINMPDIFLYTMGIIKYENLVTKKIKTYKFQIQSQPATSHYNLYLINENY